jgi:sortase A
MAIGRLITQVPSSEGTPAPRRARSGRLSRALERLLLAVGLLTAGYYIYVNVETALYQQLENRELDAILSTDVERTPSGPPGESDKARPPRKRPLQGSTIGRIEIPRLGVSVVIRAGDDARTLQLAVGHIPGTALPGEAGNIGLAGHRDTFFRRLRNIRVGDEIQIVTIDGHYTFRVQDTRVVRPTDTWVLDPTPTKTLTLITCYPFTYIGSAPDRFIVRATARPISAQQS